MTATARPAGGRGPSRSDTSARGELIDVARAASGGLLFGVPLLYTMEVWWTGSRTTPAQMGVLLVLLFVPVFVLNLTAGFRSARDVRVVDAAADTVESVAIGIVMTAVVLVLIRQITVATPSGSALGMVLYESIPFCLGVGVARHFLKGGRDGNDDDEGSGGGAGTGHPARRTTELNGTIADLGATVIGAVFISLSIAPTDEVPMIASTITPGWLLLVLAASLVISYAIVFVAGFTGQDRRQAQEGVLQRPISETVASYLVALATAFVMLWVFRRADVGPDLLTRVVVLGLPAAVGGAAGRLAM